MSFQHPVFCSISDEQGKWLNRRGTVRYQCAPATAGKVACDGRQDIFGVWVLDISRGGAGIALARPLPAGQEINIQISCPDSSRKLQFLARVVHSTEQVDSGWFVGLEFLRPLTEEELDLLLN